MPETKVDEKKAQEQAEKQAEALRADGRWARDEGDDNAIYASDENYVGTEPERQNYAYETDKPLASDPGDDATDDQKAEAELFTRVAEENKNLQARAVVTTPRGTISGGAPHPTERGARPGYVEGSNREATDVARTATKGETEQPRQTGENDAAKAEVEKGNTPAPAAKPAKD